MPNTSVAGANHTTARAPVPVLGRTVLSEDGVVEVKVAKDAIVRTVPNGAETLKYAQFKRCVNGGVVNLFLHADTPAAYLGKSVRAKAQVIRKDFIDGRSFLQVDLHLVPKETALTHKLVVTPGLRLPIPAGGVAFETPKPLEGTVTITPISATAEA
jgi:hypothetical protein